MRGFVRCDGCGQYVTERDTEGWIELLVRQPRSATRSIFDFPEPREPHSLDGEFCSLPCVLNFISAALATREVTA